jgi:hypothetical protein
MQDTTQDLRWVAKGMQTNTLVWKIDGSYNRKRAAVLSGMRWIILITSGIHRLNKNNNKILSEE